MSYSNLPSRKRRFFFGQSAALPQFTWVTNFDQIRGQSAALPQFTLVTIFQPQSHPPHAIFSLIFNLLSHSLSPSHSPSVNYLSLSFSLCKFISKKNAPLLERLIYFLSFCITNRMLLLLDQRNLISPM